MSASWVYNLRVAGFFTVYIVVSCLGLYLIKSAASWRAPVFFLGFGLYAGGAVMWMVILRMLPLSFAFPIAAGALTIGTMLTGVVFLREVVTVWQSVGAAMIVLGIALIAGMH